MGRILCLLYHRVNNVRDQLYNLTVSPEEFDQHIKYLRENYRTVRFDENWNLISEDAIAITFDDGYADNYVYALPVLERYKVPATIFVSTGNIGTSREFWWDDIERVLTSQKCYPSRFCLHDALYEYTWETVSEFQRQELAKTLRWLLRMEPNDVCFKAWIKQLKTWAGVKSDEGRVGYRSLDKEQLKKLARSPYITIGAHTVSHLSLGALSKEMQEKEIGDSIHYLEKELGYNITIFSYPFGSKMDYNADTLEICKKLGITKAATTNAKLWTEQDEPYLIPRFAVKNGSMDVFVKQIENFFNGCLL